MVRNFLYIENEKKFQWIMQHPDIAWDEQVSRLSGIGETRAQRLENNFGMTKISHLMLMWGFFSESPGNFLPWLQNALDIESESSTFTVQKVSDTLRCLRNIRIRRGLRIR